MHSELGHCGDPSLVSLGTFTGDARGHQAYVLPQGLISLLK